MSDDSQAHAGATPALELIPVWKQVGPELASELISFWARNNALPDPTKAAERASQVVCISRDAQGHIWGVGTAYLGILPSFGQPSYLYRQFFDAGARGQKQTIPFICGARDILEAYNASLPRPESIGVCFELQNDALQQRYQAIHEEIPNAYFLGYSPRGNQLRMMPFKGAKLLLPPKKPDVPRQQPQRFA